MLDVEGRERGLGVSDVEGRERGLGVSDVDTESPASLSEDTEDDAGRTQPMLGLTILQY